MHLENGGRQPRVRQNAIRIELKSITWRTSANAHQSDVILLADPDNMISLNSVRIEFWRTLTN